MKLYTIQLVKVLLTMSRRTQTVRREIGRGTWYFYSDPPAPLQPRVWYETAELISFDHPEFFRTKGGDSGGPFWSSKGYISLQGAEVQAQGLGRAYHGTLLPMSADGGVANYRQKPLSFDDMVAAGSTAISRTIPTSPVSGASIFLGELREGLPHIVGTGLLKNTAKTLKGYKAVRGNARIGRSHGDLVKADVKGSFRETGSEYLNVEFGWKPMIADLRKFAIGVKESNKTIRQLHRDSGKVVRRKYHFPTEESRTEPDGPKWGYVAPFKCDGSQVDSWMLGGGPLPTGYRQWSTTTVKTWFSGSYTYAVPSQPSGLMEHLDKADAECNKILGTRLTPDVVWELAPWSWAVDWFSNVGDVIHNFSSFGADSLVLNYGYIMRHSTQGNHTSWEGYINSPSGGPVRVELTLSEMTSQKLRLRASPFGFGIDMGALSPRQIAITSSLGMSRAPRLSL